jgi:transcriptional regulator with XRE-family HTH domain
VALSKETIKHRLALGRKIKYLRELNNITQMELAKALGYESTGTISQIENGERGMKAEKMVLAANFLGIPLEVLAGGSVMDVEDLKMISMLVEMAKLPPAKRPERYQTIKDLILK